ncbi:hypothetical protein CC80DRAFT_267434 [Byssothecium circinans]|uniref:Uncharacterized protein n=1 Tax=Byssothecium circinans TaxID=147558 RepID=A0A6A5U7S7_9PLEO|nr:hypothetical protein CC80DRAFT_267434 [Byssothecium circinans]
MLSQYRLPIFSPLGRALYLLLLSGALATARCTTTPPPSQAPTNQNPALLLHPTSSSADPAAAIPAPPAAGPQQEKASGAGAGVAVLALAVLAVDPAPPAASAAAALANLPQSRSGTERIAQQQQQQVMGSSTGRQTCTFRAYQMQRCERGEVAPVSYLQINSILREDGSVAVDVQGQRPREAFNSYEKLRAEKWWDVADLETGDVLRVSLSSVGDSIDFAVGEKRWTTDRDVDEGEWMGGCSSEGWLDGQEEWGCAVGLRNSRRRTLLCGFPCGVEEKMELK